MAPFDLDACIEQLMRKQLLHEALLREICEKTKEVLMRESNVVHVSAPVTVVGDIHGCVLHISLTYHALTAPKAVL
jgi:serine/threonine-protein phosphatase PPG1